MSQRARGDLRDRHGLRSARQSPRKHQAFQARQRTQRAHAGRGELEREGRRLRGARDLQHHSRSRWRRGLRRRSRYGARFPASTRTRAASPPAAAASERSERRAVRTADESGDVFLDTAVHPGPSRSVERSISPPALRVLPGNQRVPRDRGGEPGLSARERGRRAQLADGASADARCELPVAHAGADELAVGGLADVGFVVHAARGRRSRGEEERVFVHHSAFVSVAGVCGGGDSIYAEEWWEREEEASDG